MKEKFLQAVTEGDVAKVKELLKTDPQLAQATDENGISAILKAAYYRKNEIVETLLAAGMDLNIFEAAATGQIQRVSELIKMNKTLVNAYSPDGFTPLGLATFFGHLETVEALLAVGADVNLASREAMKVAPLNSAAAARQVAIGRLLLALGANANSKSEGDFTPLHTAAANGDLEFAKLLLEHKAEINARSKDGKTPLGFALERNQTAMAEFLRQRGGVQ